MILTAHQPVYLPWLGLFHKIALSDTFCYFDDVQYQKKDWNNRNRIKTPQGPAWLTVPVLTRGHREKTIGEIEINNSLPWRRKHWKTIYLSYKDAPHFGQYAGFFEDAYRRDWTYLSDLDEHMLKFFLDSLGIDVKYVRASEMHFEGAKSGLVLDMCRKLGADVYIFGALGRGYADEAAFREAGVGVHFQDYRHPVYPQLWGGFVSHLSVVDLLFNVGGPRALDVIMEGNVTREDLEGGLCA